MNKIKFSHLYHKIKDTKQAILLMCLPIKLEDLSKEFLAYDTDKGTYPLPKKGDYLMLIFQKNISDIFTTLRRYTLEKLEYYKSRQGQWFDIVLEQKEV